MRALRTAGKGKGIGGTLRRVRTVVKRYGMTRKRMSYVLERYLHTLRKFGCTGTFPVPAVVLKRSKKRLVAYRQEKVEFAVHGLQHVDHTLLTPEQQIEQLQAARELFGSYGLSPRGFRAPYLRWNDELLTAVRGAGFLYDASRAIAWPLGDGQNSKAYERALSFYGATAAKDQLCLPRWCDGLVQIPYCLPDDEALVERLGAPTEESITHQWLDMLERIHVYGELFTLALHPERFPECEASLVATLQKARTMSPPVWVTSLEEISEWWIKRMTTRVFVHRKDDRIVHVKVRGPAEVSLILRGTVLPASEADRLDEANQLVRSTDFELRSMRLPIIGLAPSSSPRLKAFLDQQGYVVKTTRNEGECTVFLDRPRFGETDERPLLRQIESGKSPLVRLARWPMGARSALCVTGDLDALAVWDYAARLVPS